MTYTINIPSYRDTKLGRWREARVYYDADLVDILLKCFVPPKDKVDLYYGPGAPSRVYNATLSDRLVFKLANGDFIVIPNVPLNRGHWRKDDE